MAVFMFEGLRVAAGQVILDKAMAEDELELAVRQHTRLVYRIACSVLRNHHDAEDATREVFVRVLHSRRKLAGVDDPRGWLRGERDNQLGLYAVIDASIVLPAEQKAQPVAPQPVLHSMRSEIHSVVSSGKPNLISSMDVPAAPADSSLR